MSSWSDTVIWWQVYPLGFVGAEKSALPAGSPVEHRLSRLEPWLDYLIELGCNGLALNPIFSSESHGYDIVDHFAVDPRLGDDADVDALIDACHRRGIRVLFDGVFNHVGRGFPGFVDVLENRQDSSWVPWFDIDWDADGYDGFGYRKFEGHGGLVALEPRVAGRRGLRGVGHGALARARASTGGGSTPRTRCPCPSGVRSRTACGNGFRTPGSSAR